MRDRRYLGLFTVLVFVFSLGFHVNSIGDVAKKDNSKIVSAKKTVNQVELKEEQYLEYTFKVVEKYQNNLIYKISYPIFNDEDLNKKIYDYISTLAFDFKNEFQGETTQNQKYMFNLSTDIGELNNLVFLKFDIEKSYKTYPNPVKSTKTMIIDLNENKEILPKDFLSKNYKDLFYEDAKRYFFNTYGITITKLSENFKDISPQDNEYNKVFYKDGNMQVFIYDYKKQDEVYFNVNQDEFLPYVKKAYLEKPTQTTTEMTTKIITETSTQTTTQNIKTTTEITTKKQQQGRVIDKNKPMLALTFDDGPNGKNTNRILDILQKNNSVATFFVVSRRLDTDKDVIKRMSDMGCEIGNHTANHKDLTKLSGSQIKSEISIVNQKIKDIIGKEATVVRVPYGAINDNVRQNVNYPFIMWNIDTKDWKTRDAQAIQKEVIGKVKDGDIILMHDLYSTTADACEVIIPALVKQGFQLVTVDELLQYKGIDVQNGVKYFNGRK